MYCLSEEQQEKETRQHGEGHTEKECEITKETSKESEKRDVLLRQVRIKLKPRKTKKALGHGATTATSSGKVVGTRSIKTGRAVHLDKWLCYHCRKPFTRKANLVMHLKRHKNIKSVDTAVQSSELQSSIHMVTVEKYPCHLCAETFTSKAKMFKHAKTAHQGTWLCPCCHRSFVAKSILIEHMRTEHKEIGNKSSDRVFSLLKDPSQMTSSEDTDDIRIVEVDKWLCHVCDKSFKDKQLLAAHLKALHLGKWLCHFCDEPFTDKEELVSHLKTHGDGDGKRPNIVVIKQPETKASTKPKLVAKRKSTKTNGNEALDVIASNIESFEVTDTSLSLFKCTVCHKFFKLKKSLQKHILKHEMNAETEPHDQVASNMESVQINEPSVTMFKCNMCGKYFRYKKSLKKHILKHTSQCQFCHQILETSLLDRHVREVHPRGDYLCVICNMKISQKAIFDYHMKQFHDKNDPEKKREKWREKKARKYIGIPPSEIANPDEVLTKKCDYCLLTIEASRMETHMERYHPNGEYVCAPCNYLVIARKGQKAIYTYHMKHFHGVTDPEDTDITETDVPEMSGSVTGSSKTPTKSGQPTKRNISEQKRAKAPGSAVPEKKLKKNSGVVITVRAVETASGKTAVIATTTKHGTS